MNEHSPIRTGEGEPKTIEDLLTRTGQNDAVAIADPEGDALVKAGLVEPGFFAAIDDARRHLLHALKTASE